MDRSPLRYKLREEKVGCMLFDNELGQVERLNEKEYETISGGKIRRGTEDGG